MRVRAGDSVSRKPSGAAAPRERRARRGEHHRIPVLVVTGFLGAGKTTLLRNLLSDSTVTQRRPAVVVNEFGKVGIDGAQLPEGDFARFEINSGSIFCVCTRTALLQAFTEMTVGRSPGMVLVEATGLAEPSDLTLLLELPGLADRFAWMGGVCVVDPTVFPRIVHTLRPAKVQAESAAVVIVNKADIASESELKETRRLVAQLNPAAAVIVTAYCRIPGEKLLGMVRETAPTDPGSAQSRLDATARTVVFGAVVDIAALEYVLRRRGRGLFRCKGVVRSRDGAAYFIETEAGRLRRRPAAPAEERRIQGAGVINLVGSAPAVASVAAALEALSGKRSQPPQGAEFR